MNAEQVRENAEDAFDATVESARDRVQHAFERGKEQWMEVQDQAVKQCKEAAQQTDKYVRANPWQAVGIAAAVGLVAGLLIRRR